MSNSNKPEQLYVFYKGNDKDFLVFIDREDYLDKYVKGDTTIPLSYIVSNFEVYRTITGRGSSGKLYVASDAEIAEEFGDFKNLDSEIIPRILKEGVVQKMTKRSFDQDDI
ncbi:hypothetical protein CANINC_000857 [Pichia inconspicua]|uniref:Ribosome maturation protein SDO1/SBDS N-terminal domain-containing protein n=1 Tax=Pichia inconspicua TaxID=52247 RepID=A0A4T0X6N0_9ASCO|nr:hypothetical protein CANINC_000857 [[Candida] inconspicua]